MKDMATKTLDPNMELHVRERVGVLAPVRPVNRSLCRLSMIFGREERAPWPVIGSGCSKGECWASYSGRMVAAWEIVDEHQNLQQGTSSSERSSRLPHLQG
jgi:hypothetical protein